MGVLSKEDLENVKKYEYEEETVRFGLLVNGWVVLLFEDRTMNNDNMNKLLYLTDGEIVKVHAKETRRVLRFLSGERHSVRLGDKLDVATANLLEKIVLNPSFEVQISPSIDRISKFVVKQQILVNNDRVHPGLNRLKYRQLLLLARLFGATEYLAEVEVVQEILPIASQYRSAPR